MDSNSQRPNEDPFKFYFNTLMCNVQITNNELLREILHKNGSCKWLINQSSLIPLAHAATSEHDQYAWIDEFRMKVPLTTYVDYADDINQMIDHGEKNLLSSEDVVYYSLSSGTTAEMKRFPLTLTAMRKISDSLQLGHCILQRSLPFTLSSSLKQQKSFTLLCGKKSDTFFKSKDGIPIGPISQSMSAAASFSRNHPILPIDNTLTLNIIEDITDFETSVFIQLVFALANCNIYAYSVIFAPGFIHTVKLIEKYYKDMCNCIQSNDFNCSSLVQKNISDSKLISTLNQKLIEVIVEHGGEIYRNHRVEHIRKECANKNVYGILHRLWPNLCYACTTIGGTFAIYKETIKSYCGEELLLINLLIYGASEGFFGVLASIYTDEYFLLPTHAFFEFIREEDVKELQPKTLLISEIEPDHRYELVCTTDAGLVRYRMGDMINCTRFFDQTNDLVPLTEESVGISRIPLISLAYRIGTVLSIYGERTNEQHVVNALEGTVREWREEGIPVQFHDFSSCPNLDASPSKYVIFLELIIEQECTVDLHQIEFLKNTADAKVEQHLCKVNQNYQDSRDKKQLDRLNCILVRSGTCKNFLCQIVGTKSVSPLQVKPHRILKNEGEIKFFHDNQVDNSLY